MNLNAEKKRLKIVLPVFLILAITGSFALSTGKDLPNTNSNKDNPGSGSYFSSTVRTVDWLAEDTPTINNANKYSNTPLRNGLIRVFIFTGIFGIAMFHAKSNFKINKNDIFPKIKNLVPLKLRI